LIAFIEPTDSKKKKLYRASDGKLNGQSKKISSKFCGLKRRAQRGVTRAKSVKRRTILPRNVLGERQFTILKAKEGLKEISVVRIQAVEERAVFARMSAKQQPIRFQIDCSQV